MRKRCKRKIWSTNINPIAHAIAGAAVADTESLNKLRLAELAAIDAMTKGAATIDDWRWLADVVNLAEMMGKNGIGPEVLEYCQVAQDELFKSAKRYEKTKVMGLTGVGIKAMKDVWEFHDLQRTSVARSQYEQMIKKTADYIRSRGQDVVEIK